MTGRLLAVNQRMTPHNDFLDDLGQISAAGYSGIGLDELKLPPGSDARALEAFDASGLVATYVTPAVWPIIAGPLDQPGHPAETESRVEAICASIERLSRFAPLGVIVSGGRSGDPDRPAGSAEELGGPLGQLADVAASFGLDVVLELLPRRKGSALSSIPDALALLDELDRDNIGLLIDVAHVWDAPERDELLQAHAARVGYVQLNDVRPHERTWADRLLPGDGRGQAPGIAAALIEGGYDGWFELEVFSDDGTYGVELPDSLWLQPHEQLLRQGRNRMDQLLARAGCHVAAEGVNHA